MTEAVVYLRQMQQQLSSRVREALEDVTPEVAGSAVGRVTQASILVYLAAELLTDHLGHSAASQIVIDVAQRQLKT